MSMALRVPTRDDARNRDFRAALTGEALNEPAPLRDLRYRFHGTEATALALMVMHL